MNYELFIQTKKKYEIIDITREVEKRIKNGRVCVVFIPHATAAVIVNEFEPHVEEDYKEFFRRMVKGEWRHNQIDNNAEAHLLSALISPSVTIPIREGRLELGTWQRVMLVEWDGPRKRRIIITVI